MERVGFRFAFAIEGYFDNESKMDPRYVKYIVRARGVRDGVEYEKQLPYHKCTEEEWNAFPPISKASASVYEGVRNDPKRGMQCLDWQDNEDYTIYGREIDKDHQRIEVIMVPCNYKHAEFLEISGEDTVSEECIADLD